MLNITIMKKPFIKTICIVVCLCASVIHGQAQTGAYYTGVYRNLFKEYLGKTDAEVQTKINSIWTHFFVTSSTKVYNEVGTDMAYIYDTGNSDVRTEGMSYGMMICVELDKQTEFNKIWKWAKTYMQYGSSSPYYGYFAWQCNTDGSIKGNSPASDGEAYFITALFFAAHRWGNGTGIYNYESEAQDILAKIMNKTGASSVYPYFNTTSNLATFVPYGDSWTYTDPSYNLPAFFELWAKWSTSNQTALAKTPAAARTLLKNASNTTTGLFPDYSTFAGAPYLPSWKTDYDSKRYQYDAIRCAMNVGMDYNWFRTDSANQVAMMTRLLTFFQSNNFANGYFDWNGGNASGSYSEGMAGANGVGAFAVNTTLGTTYTQRLWNVSPPTGTYRYYNGMVYFLSMLHASGYFKIYQPAVTGSPVVSISSPKNAASVATGTAITITATATDPDGTVANVAFYDGTTLLGVGTVSRTTYTYTWNGATAGSHSITAVVTDNAGNKTTSTAVAVSVTVPAVTGTIVIRAKGVTGTEIINLEVDGTIIKSWTVTTSYADYTTTANVNGLIHVNYTNDSTGRDAQVDYIIVADSTYQAEAQTVNTAYYANGSCGGGSNSEMMQCTGYIEFATAKVIDNCPSDPNKLNPGACGCGVVDLDTDKDGIADCNDTDDDGDGVADVDDCDPLNAAVGGKTTYYADLDGDGKGDPNMSVQSCSIPANYVTDNTDLCPNDGTKIVPGACGCGVVEGTCVLETISLKAGWNFVGCPINGSTAVEKALSSIWSNVETVKDLDSFYSSINPLPMNSLKTVDWGKGYLVRVTAPCVLTWIVK